jgi:OOP family OmpA-OmpF porin
MKTKHLIISLLVLVLALVLSGCAGKSMGPADTGCTNNNTNSMLRSGDYQKKIDSFLIIQDASSSMSEKAGTLGSYNSKLAQSKDMVRCLNATLPENFDVNAGLRGFGPFYAEKGLIYGMEGYTKAGLDSAILSIGGTGGVTPIANSLIHGAYDLLDKPGKKVAILFSDGVNTDAASSPAAAAASMKEMHGNNICIYTIQLGDDPKGRIILEEIAAAGKCGFAINSSNIEGSGKLYIGAPEGMEKFVTDVFLTKVMKKPAPVMKKPVMKKPVMEKPVEKITMTLYFEFDFDKAVVRPEYHDDATKIADAMKEYPEANVLLEGHTDSVGTEEYNMTLSRRRANNVKMYLVEKFNVDASRISTVGYGTSKPVATNDTEAGRQKNRRVVANIE